MAELYKQLGPEIVKATQEVFDTMIMMTVEAKKAAAVSDSVFESNISTMLGLGGEIRGLLAIHFPEKVAVEITSSFLGMTVAELDDDVQDAIGELANMVAGNLKNFFSANKIQTELAIPTIVVGKSYRTSGLAGADKVRVFFDSEPGDFVIELKYVFNT